MSGDGTNTLNSTATFLGTGDKTNELDAFIVRAAIDDINASVADGIGIGISFHVPDDVVNSSFNTDARSTAKILNKITNVADGAVTSDLKFNLIHNNTLNTVLQISPGATSETNNTFLSITNNSGSDADGDRTSKIIFKGTQSDGTTPENWPKHRLLIQNLYNKGQIKFKINDGMMLQMLYKRQTRYSEIF